MWYKDKNKIDYDKPILAKRKDGAIYLLIPALDLDRDTDYKIIGYNWLIVETGYFNSQCNFKNAESAMKSYENCEFKNIDLLELAKKEFEK